MKRTKRRRIKKITVEQVLEKWGGDYYLEWSTRIAMCGDFVHRAFRRKPQTIKLVASNYRSAGAVGVVVSFQPWGWSYEFKRTHNGSMYQVAEEVCEELSCGRSKFTLWLKMKDLTQ